MGRFGWIALTGVAMAGGVMIHSDTFREGVIISDHRIEDKAEIIEQRIDEIGERIERGEIEPDEIGQAVAEAIEEADAEIDAQAEVATSEAADQTDDVDANARARINGVTDEIEQLREDGLLSQEQYSALIAQFSATVDADGEEAAENTEAEPVE